MSPRRILRCWLLALSVLLVLRGGLHAQLVCVRQPESRLVYRDVDGSKKHAAEWACAGGTRLEAFQLLAAADTGPMAFAKVDQLAARVNAKSRKSTARHILNGAAFVLPLAAAALDDRISDAVRLGMAAGPRAIEKSFELVAGYPDEFARTPEQDGFFTLYSLAVDPTVKTVALSMMPTKPAPTTPEPQELKLGGETAAERVNRWRRETAKDGYNTDGDSELGSGLGALDLISEFSGRARRAPPRTK